MFREESRVGLVTWAYSNSAIERGRRKCVGVFRVKSDHHYVVAVPLEDLHALPLLVPIPQLDQHIVRRSKNQRLSRMNCNATDVICVSFKGFDFGHGIVIVNSHQHIVRASDDPLFSGDEFGTTY